MVSQYNSFRLVEIGVVGNLRQKTTREMLCLLAFRLVEIGVVGNHSVDFRCPLGMSTTFRLVEIGVVGNMKGTEKEVVQCQKLLSD